VHRIPRLKALFLSNEQQEHEEPDNFIVPYSGRLISHANWIHSTTLSMRRLAAALCPQIAWQFLVNANSILTT
jgi:hypothetical protein